MYLSNKVIKAQDIKLTDSSEKARVCFIHGICHIPANEADFNDRENNMDIGSEIEQPEEQPEEQIEKRVKIAAEEAYDRGFSKGVIEGIDLEKRKSALPVESVAKLIRELKVLKQEFLKGSEKGIIDLVFLIAGSVIHKEVSTEREVVLPVISDAMKNMKDRDGVCIRMNPEDHRYITEAKHDFLNSYGDILIEKDEEIGQGGAVIETHSGIVDARLDQQLNKIRESFHDKYGF